MYHINLMQLGVKFCFSFRNFYITYIIAARIKPVLQSDYIYIYSEKLENISS